MADTPVLTDEGKRRLAALREANDHFRKLKRLEIYITNAIKAANYLRINEDYIVIKRKVIIINNDTGRLMHGRVWDFGLHRFVEIKEGLRVGSDDVCSAHISINNYIRAYEKVAGLTGTTGNEVDEFSAAYGLPVILVPPHRPSQRIDLPAILTLNGGAKIAALMRMADEVHGKGQPLLVGTRSIAESGEVFRLFRERDFRPNLLNMLQAANEQRTIDAAGAVGSVTVATQVAGRGTDIRPSADAIALGGLHVFDTEMSSSRRVDDQLRGRTGRQGEPGMTRQFVALDDPIIRKFAKSDEVEALRAFIISSGNDAPEASPEMTRILQTIQLRSEAEYTGRRNSERRKDAHIEPHRAVYFAMRKALLLGTYDEKTLAPAGIGRRYVTNLNPFETKRLLEILEKSWESFTMDFDTRWILAPNDISPGDAGQLFKESVIEPFHAARKRPLAWAGGAIARARDFVWTYPVVRLARAAFKGASFLTAMAVFAPLSKMAKILNLDRVCSALCTAGYNLWPFVDFLFLRGCANFHSSPSSALQDFVNALETTTDFTRGIRFSPSIAETSIENIAILHSNRGAKLESAGDRLAAAQHHRIAQWLYPCERHDRNWDRIAKGLSDDELALVKTDTPMLTHAYLYRARQAVDNENYKNGELYYGRVIALDPLNAQAHLGLATSLNQQEKYEDARKSFVQRCICVLFKSVEFSNIQNCFSKMHGFVPNTTRVLDIFTRAKLEPPNKHAKVERNWMMTHYHSSLGNKFFDSGEYQRAIDEYTKALEADPINSEAMHQRARAYHELEKYEEAMRDYVRSARHLMIDGGYIANNLMSGHDTTHTWNAPGNIDELFKEFEEYLIRGV